MRFPEDPGRQESSGRYQRSSGSYEAAEKFLAQMGMKPEDIFNGPAVYYVKDYGQMAKKLGIGEMTLRDIVKELTKPGRDPREECQDLSSVQTCWK